MSLGKLLGKTVDVIEIAIGFVFVFLVKFGIVEAFIIEFGGFRSSRLGSWGASFRMDRSRRL